MEKPMSAVALYSYDACPFAQRSRMTLLEKQVDFKLVEIDLYDRPDWWARLSPYGKVPLLKHGDGVVYESRIINEYLEDVFPSPALMPSDPYQRAQARIWIDYCDTRFLPACHQLIPDRKDPNKQAENRARLAEAMIFMETEGLRRLSDGPFWMGKQITLVDIHYAPFIERFPCYQELWDAPWPAECTRLRQWFDAISERASFTGTRHEFEFHLERYRKYDQAA
jgi:glutathione S-transferase